MQKGSRHSSFKVLLGDAGPRTVAVHESLPYGHDYSETQPLTSIMAAAVPPSLPPPTISPPTSASERRRRYQGVPPGSLTQRFDGVSAEGGGETPEEEVAKEVGKDVPQDPAQTESPKD